ncbi:di-trans,poly-cis-decaprenylcistransferase [Candidatus Dojkabacteria bacterium]|uniref:Isoprenyl transferase n=1 Tax=Candidatus Dojkabacteria bacterium TaxID=2099670 RepID=A0A955RJS2_9BACT|nr:di-trans,poly-cis-decaprenylcistransferase [Candidatus Dojkabacteria bacterium]
MTNKTIEISVKGRVQGVYFRKSAANFASSLRLTGYVENLPNGSVHIVGQGPESHLEELLKWCQRGSLFAHVEGMSYEWVESDEIFSSFSVKRKGSILKDQAKSFLNLGKKLSHEFGVINKETTNIPEHVVIIPNGNRTWSREKGLKSWEGYWHVLKHKEKLIDAARDLHIKHLTFWGFSTENWKRSEEEIDQLMKVFHSIVDKFGPRFIKEQVRFRHIGRKDRLPEDLVEKIIVLEEKTKDYQDESVNIAFDYGGRDEILRVVDTLIKSGKTEVTEEDFSELLDTAGLPDPDLIIRTAGEKRLSGLMPWQSVYSEFYSTNVYFPDFGVEHLREAILDFSARKRTFGGDKNIHAKQTSNHSKVIPNIAV